MHDPILSIFLHTGVVQYFAGTACLRISEGAIAYQSRCTSVSRHTHTHYHHFIIIYHVLDPLTSCKEHIAHTEWLSHWTWIGIASDGAKTSGANGQDGKMMVKWW